ncbi:MAG TPA: hypothetical protein VML54_11355 [Candidatus Limnocylindrales bacterium]|nr:hypothetical protein [Candidatus Limnocylindrales bacterium]
MTIGIDVQNPAGQPDADLYAGALLPDGRTAVFLTGPSRFGGVGTLPAPASFVPMQVVPNGAVVNIPELLRMPLPPAALLPPGTYQLFVALARRGAFADNRIDLGDIVAVDIKTVTILP